MKLSRRSIIKAGIGFSASFFARPVDVFAQAQPLMQKKIPVVRRKHSDHRNRHGATL